MSGRNGWMRPNVGRPPKQPDVIRCPDGSWWLLECYQQDREAFTAKVAKEQKRMALLGLHQDRVGRDS